MTPAMRGAEGWEAWFSRTLDERAATLGPAFGWFVIGALLLIVGVFGVVTIVIALREARERKSLEALAADTAQVRQEVSVCAEPQTLRTGSEGAPT